MRFFKPEWGNYSYINKKKTLEIIKTIIMFSVALIIYFGAFFYFKTNKNLFTVFAVLTILPAAKCAVSMIMFLRFKSLSEEEFKSIKDISYNGTTIYEMIFTTDKAAYLVKACAVLDNTIIMWAEYDEKKSKQLSEHIKACLERDYIKGYSLKIFSNINDFTNRLKEMNNNLTNESDTIKPVKNLFMSITL